MTIRLNGESLEIEPPVTVGALLKQLDIDARRVAVEHNLAVLKRSQYDSTLVRDGDEIEVVNFVGGGLSNAECGVWNSELMWNAEPRMWN